jgi:hypothetical protein
LVRGKGKHIKVKAYTWVMQRKDKQAEKELTRIIYFRLAF